MPNKSGQIVDLWIAIGEGKGPNYELQATSTRTHDPRATDNTQKLAPGPDPVPVDVKALNEKTNSALLNAFIKALDAQKAATPSNDPGQYLCEQMAHDLYGDSSLGTKSLFIHVPNWRSPGDSANEKAEGAAIANALSAAMKSVAPK